MAKPRKVEEPAGTYSGSSKPEPKAASEAPTPGSVRYLDRKTFRKSADKVFKERKELLRRLAQ